MHGAPENQPSQPVALPYMLLSGDASSFRVNPQPSISLLICIPEWWQRKHGPVNSHSGQQSGITADPLDTEKHDLQPMH